MRLFVYEHLMAGGFGPHPPASLLAEGRAMLSAIVEDFAAAGHQVSTILHPAARWPSELPSSIEHALDDSSRRAALARLSYEADWSLVIAPEIDGELIRCCRIVREEGGRLLGSSPAALGICCDKHATAEALRALDVPVPDGILLNPGNVVPADFPFPAVLKPCDGAGSQDVLLMRSRPSVEDWPRRKTLQRLERFCPGQTVSVALLVGPPVTPRQSTGGASGTRKGTGRVSGTRDSTSDSAIGTCRLWSLPACRQHLSDDGRFTYQGGSLPIEPALAARATALARRAVVAVPGLFGYVGVDLVLGADASGRDDVVIEINPRLTTSYLGLRKLASVNLTAALLNVAQGHEPALDICSAAVAFTAHGVAEKID